MEQTAVEWLVKQLFQTNNNTTDSKKMDSESIIQQAKEMEKEQIVDAYRGGKINQLENSEIYYNKTFKSE